MKVSIRRHGIVIRSVDVTGDRARIGSGEECEVRIDDPYLAAHVADLTRVDGTWRVVDAGASLEGLSREGSRVEDEPVQFDYSYSVGGFELVVDGEGMPRTAAAPKPVVVQQAAPHPDSTVALPMEDIEEMKASQRKGALIPATVVEVPNPRPAPPSRPVPATMMEPAPIQPRAPARPAAPELTFQPVSVPGASTPVVSTPVVSAPGVAPTESGSGKSKSKGMVLILVGAIVVLFLLMVVAVTRKKPSTETMKDPVKVAPKPIEAPVAAKETPVERGDRLAASLKLDEALTAWEEALADNPQPELQLRYARTALDLARVYAAAHDDGKAKIYFEKARKYAPADSVEAQMAERRLK